MGTFARASSGLLVAILCLFFPGRGGSTEIPVHFIGEKAPVFTADDVDGGKISLEALLKEKRVVVVNFWGLRCSACIEEIPHLNRIEKEFGAKGVQILGVNADGAGAPLLKRLMEKSGIQMDYPVLTDPALAIADAYRLTGAPLTVLVDSLGTIRYRHENFVPGDEKELREKILALIAEKCSGRNADKFRWGIRERGEGSME